MPYVKILLGLAVAGLLLSVLAVQAAEKMDCSAMFRKAEDKISSKKKAPAEKKAELYEMTLKAYNECKKGKEKEANDFFKQVFDTSDRM